MDENDDQWFQQMTFEEEREFIEHISMNAPVIEQKTQLQLDLGDYNDVTSC